MRNLTFAALDKKHFDAKNVALSTFITTRMNIRITLAVAALTLPLSAEVATTKPPQKGAIKWDSMDLGQFFSGTYKVANTTSYKGVAVAVGTHEAPATMLFDTELLRFHAAWEGGLAKFPRGRGGLEGTIGADGDVKLSTGWAIGGGAEIKDDPRERHQGLLPDTHWRGIYINGDKTVLSYAIGKQSILEVPGSDVRDGMRIYTRTFTIAAGSDVKELLILDAGGTTKDGAAGVILAENGDKTAGVAIRGGAAGLKLAGKDGGRIVLQIPALTAPVTFQVAFASAPTAEAEKLAAALPAKIELVAPVTFTKPGAPRWGAAIEVAGKLGDSSQAYASDEIPLPEENPYKSWLRPGGHDFLPDGTCVVANISGDVWLVSGLDEKLEHVKWKRFATGLFQPLGCKVVDGQIYVLGRDQITRLHDTNKDGEADYYENFNNACVVTENYHEFALDLQTDSKGNFYYAKGSPWTPTNTSPHQGTMLKVSKDGSKLEIFATGLRAPNGLGMGPGDVLTCSDNQGHWMPSNRLNIVKQGGFYGMTPAAHRELAFKKGDGSEFKANPSSEAARKEFKTEFWGNSPIPVNGHDLPLMWLPMDIDNSSGGEVWAPPLPAGGKWGPWNGKMLQMSYGKSALFGVMQETIGGVEQGGLVRFPLSFKSGIMRGRFSPKDGQLYLSGLNVWQSNAAKDGCLHRVRYTGKDITMPIALATKANGVEIRFSGALDAASAADVGNWAVTQWNYKWTGDYGSSDFSALDPNKKGKDIVLVSKVTLSPDKKGVILELADRVPAMTLRTKCNIKAADGGDVTYQIDQAIHRIPGQKPAAK